MALILVENVEYQNCLIPLLFAFINSHVCLNFEKINHETLNLGHFRGSSRRGGFHAL